MHDRTTGGEDDGVTCPNGNRPPECTEIDPCEACTQDADAEAEVATEIHRWRTSTVDGGS